LPEVIAIERDFLGVNRCKTEWQIRIVGHGGRDRLVAVRGWVAFATESYDVAALYATLASLSEPL
jgi:hypothetical protein